MSATHIAAEEIVVVAEFFIRELRPCTSSGAVYVVYPLDSALLVPVDT